MSKSRSFRDRVLDVFLGPPISSNRAEAHSLTPGEGLAAEGPDPISSTIYGGQEIQNALVPAGGNFLLLPVTTALMLLITVVSTSYRFIIRRFSNGGGAYAVSQETLGSGASLVAAASLLVDYVLTVPVSIASGVYQLTSVNPDWRPYAVPICWVFIIALAYGNILGLRTVARLFATLLLFFVVVIWSTIGFGVYRHFTGTLIPVPTLPEYQHIPTVVGISVVAALAIRAFSNGAVALTGIESVSNGVPTFRSPRVPNAIRTLLIQLLIILVTTFGIALLIGWINAQPGSVSVIVQIAQQVWGRSSIGVFLVVTVSVMILVMASQTAFTSAPVLAKILASDGFLPKHFQDQHRRLAYNVSIVVLMVASCLLVWAYDGDPTRLIPLYSIGVFVGFTLSQAGMLVIWVRELRQGTPLTKVIQPMLVNLVGCVFTGSVLGIQLYEKADAGGKITVAIIVLAVIGMSRMKFHRTDLDRGLTFKGGSSLTTPQAWLTQGKDLHNLTIVAVEAVDRRVKNMLMQAWRYNPNTTRIKVVHVSLLDEHGKTDEEEFLTQWSQHFPLVREIPHVLSADTRSVVGALTRFAEGQLGHYGHSHVTIVICGTLYRDPWSRLLHHQRVLQLQSSIQSDADLASKISIDIVTRPTARGKSTFPQRWTYGLRRHLDEE